MAASAIVFYKIEASSAIDGVIAISAIKTVCSVSAINNIIEISSFYAFNIRNGVYSTHTI